MAVVTAIGLMTVVDLATPTMAHRMTVTVTVVYFNRRRMVTPIPIWTMALNLARFVECPHLWLLGVIIVQSHSEFTSMRLQWEGIRYRHG
jgi:hypothetical protein